MNKSEIKTALNNLFNEDDENNYEIVSENDDSIFARIFLNYNFEEQITIKTTLFLSTSGINSINFYLGKININREVIESINRFNIENILFCAYVMRDNILTIRSTGVNNLSAERIYDFVNDSLNTFFGEMTSKSVIELLKYVKNTELMN